MKYVPVIGLEVHVELKTNSKMFCGCSADYFGKAPNTHVCPVCLGLPGALPVPNKKAIEWCVMIGLALNCKIPLFSKFDRKNYFYPDLPKGYQISQYDKPFCMGGFVILNSFQDLRSKTTEMPKQVRHDTMKKRIRIRRVHMEEDTAKLVHQFGKQKSKIKNQKDGGYSLIDFNRSGVPLVEIVTEPDFESAEEVIEYLKKVQQIVRYLGVSNADMEKGDMRLEPNISLKPVILASKAKYQTVPGKARPESDGDAGQASMTDTLPSYKVEIKNINSFRFVGRAINFEIERQRQLLEKGEKPKQETRGWSEEKNATLPQRGKEEEHDYRYFPEPDIPPIRWDRTKLLELRGQIPELPDQKFTRFKKEYGLPDYDAGILTREKEMADYFEEACRVARQKTTTNIQQTTKTIANWIINKKVNITQTVPAQLIQKILATAMTVKVDEKTLKETVNKVLIDNPKAVSDYKKGKEQALMFLVGQVMRKFKKKIDAQKVRDRIKSIIQEDL